jgi:hypothetical protein
MTRRSFSAPHQKGIFSPVLSLQNPDRGDIIPTVQSGDGAAAPFPRPVSGLYALCAFSEVLMFRRRVLLIAVQTLTFASLV